MARCSPRRPKDLGITLNDEQKRVNQEISATVRNGGWHLLTGHGGSGKTKLSQHLLVRWHQEYRRVVASAPTHKAVSVIESGFKAAKIHVPARTIQSVLGLKPAHNSSRLEFTRPQNASEPDVDILLVDEASMLSEELMGHIAKYLREKTVIFVGDPAQLPPVGEKRSRVFEVDNRSHLATPVRQAMDSPIYHACEIIRASQGSDPDWSWAKPARHEGKGIYRPSDQDAWIAKAFKSKDYKDNPDNFRLITWTNDAVKLWNQKIRTWIHGTLPAEPFILGEYILARAPVMEGDDPIINTNEEVLILAMKKGRHMPKFYPTGADGLGEWSADVACWEYLVKTASGLEHTVRMAIDEDGFQRTSNRLAEEAKIDRYRWRDFHNFRQSFLRGQHVPCLTVHNSQGSTFRHVFLNVAEMEKWMKYSLLEGQQGLYVGASRPTDSLVLIGM